MLKICSVLASFFLVIHVNGQQPIPHTYPMNAGPNINPMKGWNSGWWNDADYSSVGFQYIPWKDLEPIDDTFDFTAVETILNRPGSEGRHVIVRLYADWYGSQQVSHGGPSWLYSDYGVARLQAPNGKYITDFNDPNFLSEAVEAIEALTNYLDNHPRIYSFQLGVIGYWGEWHTFGFDGPGYTLDSLTQTTILNTYENNVSNAQLMGRYPWNPILEASGNIGFHNDFFGLYDHSRDFDTTVSDGAKWIDGPIGGEFPPNVPTSDLDSIFGTSAGTDIIELGHYSTMQKGSSPCELDSTSSNCLGFMDIHRKMGYNYQIASADFPEITSTYYNFDLNLTLSNIGVAPMYYNWMFQLALLDSTNSVISSMNLTDDPTTIMPNSDHTLSVSQPFPNLTNGDYRLGFRLIQPNADMDKVHSWELDARNVYVEFSNDLEVVPAYWNANHKLIGGWSILGNVEVDNSLSLSNLSKESHFRIYPNPVTEDVINLEFHAALPETLILLDVLGNEIWRTSDIQPKMYLTSLDLVNGMYFLQADYSDDRIEEKFVIQK